MKTTEKQSEGLNLHNRPQAQRSRRSKYYIGQHSERVNFKKVQSSRLQSWFVVSPRVALRLPAVMKILSFRQLLYT